MGKKYGKKINALTWVLGIILIAVLIGGGFLFSINGSNNVATDEAGQVIVAPATCPDRGYTDFSLNVYNPLNTTGAENYDVTFYLFRDNVLTNTISDTTSPTATDLACGYNYKAIPVGTNGASGDSSSVKSVSGEATIEDGYLVFKPTGAILSLTAQMEQHATMSVRAYDNNQKAYVYDSADASATDYEADGVTFTSTTGNATASDETLGMDLTFNIKSLQTDTNGNDRGILALLEMPTTKWDEPVVYLNNNKLSKVTLEGNEKDAYVDYEYAFLIPSDIAILDGAEGVDLRVASVLKDGISSATADVQVDLAIRGNALATAGTSVLTNTAVTDASTPAQVYDLFDITIDYT